MKTTRILTLLALSLTSHYVCAGAISGGGGKAIVCRDEHSKIISAEVLDLYEGRILYGLSAKKSSEPMNEQVQNALKTIPDGTPNTFSFYADLVEKHLRFSPSGTKLTSIDDSFEVAIPDNCTAEQLANYYNDNLVLVNADIWSALDETNRAALILHEAVYAGERAAGEKNSIRSRHIVASLFDSSTHWISDDEGVPEDALSCAIPNEGFFKAYKNSSGDWILQFEVVGPHIVVSKKTVTIQSADWPSNDNGSINLDEAKTFPMLAGEEKIGSGSDSIYIAKSNFEDGDAVEIEKKWEAPKDQTGKILPGFQTPRYYLSWRSASYPEMSTSHGLINCSLSFPQK